MKPQTTRAKDKVKLLNKPQHTVGSQDQGKESQALEPSEATCPIVRETL